jgi:hypothetical protein
MSFGVALLRDVGSGDKLGNPLGGSDGALPESEGTLLAGMGRLEASDAFKLLGRVVALGGKLEKSPFSIEGESLLLLVSIDTAETGARLGGTDSIPVGAVDLEKGAELGAIVAVLAGATDGVAAEAGLSVTNSTPAGAADDPE